MCLREEDGLWIWLQKEKLVIQRKAVTLTDYSFKDLKVGKAHYDLLT